jgi:hypothetical protein
MTPGEFTSDKKGEHRTLASLYPFIIQTVNASNRANDSSMLVDNVLRKIGLP